MAIYAGETECKVIYVTKGGVARRVSSVWVGDQQVFPPTNRQEIHLFTRDTQGFGRVDNGTYFAFAVPVPWWATSMDVVVIGAGEKGQDGRKAMTGDSSGAGGRSGAWVVKTVALPQSTDAVVRIGKGTSTSPHATEIILYRADGQPEVSVDDGEGTRTPNSGSTGGGVTPQTRTEYNQTHIGRAGATRNNPGGHPGGGGGGGEGAGLIGTPKLGQNGGDGYVWLRFRSNASVGGGGFTLYLGTTSGNAYQPLREWASSIGKTYQTITEITVPVSIVGPIMMSAFAGCAALTDAPEMGTSNVTDMTGMFRQCSSLTTVPQYDTSHVTITQSMFHVCSSLVSLPALDMRAAQVVSYMFDGCTSLESVTLPGMGNAFTTKQTLDMRATKLSVAAANALMHSLGKPAPGGILQLPRTASGAGTDADIATAKNWTVTFG